MNPKLLSSSFVDNIDHIETTIVDVPLRKAHFHASGSHAGQSYVLVTLKTKSGAVGYGEGVTPGGGTFWGGESVETIKVVVDKYLTPALLGANVFAHERALLLMDRAAAANQFAKSAIDIALHDVVGRLLGVPISQLYGGAVRTTIPTMWPLAAAEYESDVADARMHLASRRHRAFKIKIGKTDPESEVRRALQTVEAIHSNAPGTKCTIDLNQAWDEPTASRWLPVLQDGGVALAEQPVPGWNVAAMARLAARLDMPVMADEGLWDMHDTYDSIVRGATDVFGVKVAKGGGLRRAYKAAAIAQAAGVPLWGGMALESSIGTAASLQLFSVFPELPWGTELVGPLLIGDDLVTEPTTYSEFEVVIPQGPGLGIQVDFDKVAHYRRR